ncbi:hypothetical protein EJ04DRAFT_606032 [Polyplosphaeria fusca]|uniref:C4-dicarboxylate transporter/malic acid transport protein n=1 Tax=Polyplosphaeria fusca TaxID=682080 RepID=A0A9P4QVG5_9PLEO|nr:hypothetical protein EJ04DRAFT_606032 [Polyplosphaeria fusca]
MDKETLRPQRGYWAFGFLTAESAELFRTDLGSFVRTLAPSVSKTGSQSYSTLAQQRQAVKLLSDITSRELMTDSRNATFAGGSRRSPRHCSTSTEEDVFSNGQDLPQNSEPRATGIQRRLKHFTWAWFTCTMSGGGLGIALAVEPYRFHGLYTIGVVVMLFNIATFAVLCFAMLARLFLYPKHFLKSLVHPREAFFLSSFWLSMATILGCIQLYGINEGPQYVWLVDSIHILYWIYAAVALVNSVLQYWLFIHRTPSRPVPFSPSWFLPTYSAMLTGTIASLIAGSQPPARRMSIIISGCAYQGFGWCMAFVLIVMYVYRLVEFGPPPPSLRPGMFIPVGSGSYTIIAFIGQAQAIPRNYGYFAAHPGSADTLQTLALFVGIFLWIFMFWLFLIAVMSNVAGIPNVGFTTTWWAFIFPNVGFTVATIQIGQELGSSAILWVASVMTLLLVLTWLFTWTMCIRAVLTKRVMWPGKDEDKDL